MTPTACLLWGAVVLGAYATGFARGYHAGWREMQPFVTRPEEPRP